MEKCIPLSSWLISLTTSDFHSFSKPLQASCLKGSVQGSLREAHPAFDLEASVFLGSGAEARLPGLPEGRQLALIVGWSCLKGPAWHLTLNVTP